jgi:hypothetical protein
MRPLFSIVRRRLGLVFRRQVEKIAEINRKYAHPRLVVKKSTAFALLLLRLYLLFLVGLLIYKFVITIGAK